MKISPTNLEGLKVIELEIYGDNRGFFVERYNQQKFKDLGFDVNFVQDNHSRSAKNILRGLHYQSNPSQGKLVGVINGVIDDVAVDIRSNSKTFGEYFKVELSDSNGKLLWIPEGFAHGFCVKSESADVMYKVDNNYNPKGEGGILWNDPEISISWNVENPLLSERDKALISFSEYKKNPIW